MPTSFFLSFHSWLYIPLFSPLLTEYFTILASQNTSIDIFYVVYNRRTTDFETLKMLKCSVGLLAIVVLLHSWWLLPCWLEFRTCWLKSQWIFLARLSVCLSARRKMEKNVFLFFWLGSSYTPGQIDGAANLSGLLLVTGGRFHWTSRNQGFSSTHEKAQKITDKRFITWKTWLEFSYVRCVVHFTNSTGEMTILQLTH